MKKVLIVDDSVFIQKVASGALSGKYTTICASSGEEAIERYETEKPDMILTDLIMPQMTGLELQAKLQEKYLEQIPMMFMTADEREENESRGLEGGAMDYIRKPFKPEVLLRRVDNIMRNVARIQGLKQVAETDPMTGLLNKTFAQKVIGELCQRASGILMMVDLDSFKLVNDLHGHGMGDRILIRFSEIIRSVIRTSDVAGRMGGDEFIVFCQDIREEEIVAEKARAINEEILASAKAFMGPDMNIPLGASIGAVRVPEEGTVFQELYHKADKALYEVKQNGKHGYAIYQGESGEDAENTQASSTTSLESVRTILEERNRQKGAYLLGFENFRTVYRYLVRCMENYHNPVVLAVFTPGGGRERMERFGEVLGNSLRRSDVYTKNGNQYIVLLSRTDLETGSVIFQRVMENWKASVPEDEAAVPYEVIAVK